MTGPSDEHMTYTGSKIPFPEWAEKATIYEVNLRQYTPEGTIRAFMPHLERLNELGVKILWFMPIHPISVEKRKGGMGSYYAVQDYRAVNPEHGTLEEFKALVDQAHQLGMKVILDWVPNHTGFDHVWIKEHPEWYTKDSLGNITHPEGTDWYDVADLDYSQQDMRKEMLACLRFWVDSIGVDGYRFDVAYEVPNDFWETFQQVFSGDDPLFLLAESDEATHRNDTLFHVNYGWHLHHLMNQVAAGDTTVRAFGEYLRENEERYRYGIHMLFTSNHDENSWKGSAVERFGPMNPAMNVFAFTFQGMPLIYSGQESDLDRRLAFFEKDAIDWRDFPKQEFFASLIRIKNENPALWNRLDVRNTRIEDIHENFIHYTREFDDNRVDVLLNFSSVPYRYRPSMPIIGSDGFSKAEIEIGQDDGIEIEAYGYRVICR